MDNQNLFDEFKKNFSGYDENQDFKCGEDGSWIYAVADKNAVGIDESRRGFHYELILRGNDEHYIELHFELYKYQWAEMRDALVTIFNRDEYRREVVSTSYYSSLIWRVRRPVYKAEHINDSLQLLRSAVNEAMGLVESGDSAAVAKPTERLAGETLKLPCPCLISDVAHMLIAGSGEDQGQDKVGNRLVLPAVQRGKVWNAARIETLWDSIFRDIPIGALSVRNSGVGSTDYELLDGQQRATAIALGFDEFPDETRKYDSVLWIDLKRKNDGRYSFFVTTAAQPWGYAESESETRNQILSYGERRIAAEKSELVEGQIKPYPFQLYPVKAVAPVPYTLLRNYVENESNVDFESFCKWLGERMAKNPCLAVLEKFKPADGDFCRLCEKIRSVSKGYSVFLMSANSVSVEDIALYFTRIGKGGVVPSDEELAYSVLKSKLDAKFREKILEIHETYGLAGESRIAHLAIRLFKSESEKNKTGRRQFYSGPVFSAVMDLCKEENAGEKKLFFDFVHKYFEDRIQKIKNQYCLTQWHLARYASERNGDVFLLLLLAAGDDDLFAGYDVMGLSELLFGYATHIAYSVRKIFEEGVPVALANLSEESYYGKKRLILPINPSILEGIPVDSVKGLLDWKNANYEAAQAISEGYYNSGYGHSFNILLYACRESEKNNHFKYDSSLGMWAEDNCPWDYDHIMPHSTIEKEKYTDENEKAVCEWLKNSIGNLAPLPFSLNRSLSDSPRNAGYPCNDKDEQDALNVNGDDVESMWENGRISPLDFCKMVITRYKKMYKKWYEGTGINMLLDFKSALVKKTSDQEQWKAAQHRYSIFTKMESLLEGWTLKKAAADNKERVIQQSELHKDFCRDQVITLSIDVGTLSIALTKCGIRGDWKIGLRKLSGDSSVSKDVFTSIANLAGNVLDASKMRNENDRWWYWCEEINNVMDTDVQDIVDRLKSLHEIVVEIS